MSGEISGKSGHAGALVLAASLKAKKHKAKATKKAKVRRRQGSTPSLVLDDELSSGFGHDEVVSRLQYSKSAPFPTASTKAQDCEVGNEVLLPAVVGVSTMQVDPIMLKESQKFTRANAPKDIDCELPAVRRGAMLKATQRAQPQVRTLGATKVDVWPEHWGLTAAQLRAFANHCSAEPGWDDTFTMRQVVDNYVKPLTAGTGMGYALLTNQMFPQLVTIMVSHSWSENFMDFVHAIERSVAPDEVLFICAFSLYQNCDGCGPSISKQLGKSAFESPFYRALSRIRDDGDAASIQWFWARNTRLLTVFLIAMGCVCFAVSVAIGECAFDNGTLVCGHQSSGTKRIPSAALHVLGTIFCSGAIPAWCLPSAVGMYRGRLLVVPNFQDPIYCRLWCVYEVFVAYSLGVPIDRADSVASVGNKSCRFAQCTNPDDDKRIRAEIEVVGYNTIDAAINKIKRSLYWKSNSAIFAVVAVLVLDLVISHSSRHWPEASWYTGAELHAYEEVAHKSAELLLGAVYMWTASRNAGRLSSSHFERFQIFSVTLTLAASVVKVVASCVGATDAKNGLKVTGAACQGVLHMLTDFYFVAIAATILTVKLPRKAHHRTPLLLVCILICKDLCISAVAVPQEYFYGFMVENIVAALCWFEIGSIFLKWGIELEFVKHGYCSKLRRMGAHYFVCLFCAWFRSHRLTLSTLLYFA